MTILNKVLTFVLILHELANGNGVTGQGTAPATVDVPNVQSSLGQEARLSCSISKDQPSLIPELNKLRFCVWERLSQDKNPFIVNFNEINSQPGLYSGVRGYSYIGEGFPEGECGMKVSLVKAEDFSKWQCTLITDGKVYRGYVTLEMETPKTTEKPKAETNQTGAVASSRTAIDDSSEPNERGSEADDLNRPRPIITSYNDARAIIQPEIIIHSTTGEGGTQLIQEVKVESAGLQIKPRRQGKLIVFDVYCTYPWNTYNGFVLSVIFITLLLGMVCCNLQSRFGGRHETPPNNHTRFCIRFLELRSVSNDKKNSFAKSRYPSSMRRFFPRMHFNQFKVHHWLTLLIIPVIYLQLKTYTLVRTRLASTGSNSLGHDPSEDIRSGSGIKNGNFDQHVLEYVQARHLINYDPNAPTSYSGSRSTWRKYMQRNWTQKMGKIVAKQMMFKKGGFFVECGALDGAYLSKTILLERLLGWSGLLVEPDPILFPILKRRNRRANISDACLSTEPHPMKIDITSHKDGGDEIQTHITEKDNPNIQDTLKNSRRKFQAQCFPFWMLMAGVGRTKIDYLSLDVGGSELEILKTIPSDKISIKLISVEVKPGNKQAIQQFLESIGYKLIKHLDIPSDYMFDDLYEFQQQK